MKKNYYTFYGVLAIAGCLLTPALVPAFAMNPSVKEENSATTITTDWTGNSQKVTFYSAADVRKFKYVSQVDSESSGEKVYFVCREKETAQYGITMTGSDKWGDASIIYDEATRTGVIALTAENEVNLSLQVNAAVYPCSFTIDLFRVEDTQTNIGRYFDMAYPLTGSNLLTIPVNKYYADPSDPTQLQGEANITWVGFTANKSAMSALAVNTEYIYLFDYNSNANTLSNGRKIAQQSEELLPFSFETVAGKEYVAAICNNRPTHASFRQFEPIAPGITTVTLNSEADRKMFTYTCQTEGGETFYLQNREGIHEVNGYVVKFEGAIREGVQLPYTAYDLSQGGYSAIALTQGDVLDFSVMTSLNEEKVPFPRRVKVEAFSIPNVSFEGMPVAPGSMYDVPVALSEEDVIIAPAQNTSAWIPELSTQDYVSWAKYTALTNGIVSVEVEDYMIYVFENQGMDPVNGFSVSIPNDQSSKTAHRFAVKAGVDYRIAFINRRPLSAKIIEANLNPGEDCMLPLEQSKGAIEVVKNKTTWYAYTPAEGDNFLVLASNGKFTGKVMLHTSCDDMSPIGFDAKAGATAEYRTLVIPGQTYLIKVTAAVGTQDGAQIEVNGRAALNGESCQTAITAAMGTNAIGNELRTYWYKHTASKNCLLHLEGPAKSALKLHSDCNGRVVGTGVAQNGKMEFDYKMSEGQEVIILWTPTEAKASSFTLAENEIPETFYCDVPGTFELGNTVSMTNRLGETWYQFTADKSGFAEFIVENEEWLSSSWTSYLREGCNGATIQPTSSEMVNGAVHFRYNIQKGKSYLFYVYQYPTLNNGTQIGPNIEVETAFVDASEGEDCENPIALTLDASKEITEATKSEWFGYTVEEDGFYQVDAIIGEGYSYSVTAYLNTCGSEAIGKGNGQYGSGTIVPFKVYAEAGDKILLNAASSSTQGIVWEGSMVKISFAGIAEAGDVCVKAIAATAGTPYTYSKEKEMWYTFTVPAGKTIEVRTANGSGAPAIYEQCNGSVVTTAHFTSSYLKDENNKLIRLLVQKEAQTEAKTYLFKAPANSQGTSMTINVIGQTGIGSVNIQAVTVYPNPNNGVFYVSVEDLQQGATVMVSDLAGKTIYQQELTDNLTNIVLESVSGTYIVTVRNGNQTINQRMIIRK